MNNCGERLKNGIITENPIFVLTEWTLLCESHALRTCLEWG